MAFCKSRLQQLSTSREKKEYEQISCRLEKESQFIYYHLPVTGGGDMPKAPEGTASFYLRMLDKQMDMIVQSLMDTKSNFLFFCGTGKDRTGVVSAIILKKLGYAEETIIEDYLKSKENLLDFLTKHPQVDITLLQMKRILERS